MQTHWWDKYMKEIFKMSSETLQSFKVYSRSPWDQFPAPFTSHSTILSAAPDISQGRCDLYPWDVWNHAESEVSSQICLQLKLDLQRRKGLRTKYREVIRLVDVEIHYSVAPGFLGSSLKTFADLAFAWGKLGVLKWGSDQSQKQWTTETQPGQKR